MITEHVQSRNSERRHRHQLGFSMLELMIAVALMGVIMALAIPKSQSLIRNSDIRTDAKAVADLISFARSKAMQTGDPHLVFIGEDTAGNALTMTNGLTAAALVVADTTLENCLITGGEERWGVDAFSSAIGFQRATGVVQVPSDVGRQASVAGTGTSFSTPSSNDASWIVFGGDGIPRRFASGDCDAGSRSEIARGGGVVYVAGALPGDPLNTGRQYGIEITPLGAVIVHRYDWSTSAWRIR